ncbi:hypothetical protein OUZ56_027628 [Daphnia magna]|uniref:Uncharacterized protein n=1 Tax=Daphnia magna TaxID=35525 RepID=A0ABR0B1G5_9CRUS|nr:hypothetical protein OUZ56_027628 [Daphnia magna]
MTEMQRITASSRGRKIKLVLATYRAFRKAYLLDCHCHGVRFPFESELSSSQLLANIDFSNCLEYRNVRMSVDDLVCISTNQILLAHLSVYEAASSSGWLKEVSYSKGSLVVRGSS